MIKNRVALQPSSGPSAYVCFVYLLMTSYISKTIHSPSLSLTVEKLPLLTLDFPPAKDQQQPNFNFPDISVPPECQPVITCHPPPSRPCGDQTNNYRRQ